MKEVGGESQSYVIANSRCNVFSFKSIDNSNIVFMWFVMIVKQMFPGNL